MRFLRTNTAIRVTVGPFLSQSDGITPQTALTVTSEKLTFVVDDSNVPTLILDTAPTASGGSNDMIHISGDDSGFYDLELAAADTNHLGRAILGLNNVAAHCPVWHEFMILPANIYDAMVLGTKSLMEDHTITESYHTDGTAPTPAQALYTIMQRGTEFSIAGTTLTVKKLDGSTTAYTLTLNDATTPTSATRAT